jgi:hypothetical protein
MKYRRRIYYSAEQRAEIWDRWHCGESMSHVCFGLGAVIRRVSHERQLRAGSRLANPSSFGSKPKNVTLI